MRPEASESLRDPAAGLPPAWGVQYCLTLPTEAAALAVADELACLRHRLIAVRVHDHFRLDPSNFWYGKPSMDPELAGWWQVFSLAVYRGHGRVSGRRQRRGGRAERSVLVVSANRGRGRQSPCGP